MLGFISCEGLSLIGIQIELERESKSFVRMKAEAEKCLAQSKRIKNEKVEMESQLLKKVGGGDDVFQREGFKNSSQRLSEMGTIFVVVFVSGRFISAFLSF